MPKVVETDKFGRDYNGGKSQRVMAENLSQADARAKAKELNAKFGGEFSDKYYVVKPDDYQPYIFEGY